ncbi:MAG: DUF1579 family protein [Candidatus Omnitrophica bacterium]|nr:DUF1579 family protein [Candidatus Omnitrophota bacterium]
MLAMGTGLAQAEQGTTAKPAVPDAKQAMMEAMQKFGSPSEGHKALEPLAGTWGYAAQFWMSPDEAPESMTGTAVNTLIFGGRFLKQEVNGQPMEEGHPPFEGTGFIGYDNIRKEYQTVWFDNMMTGMMTGTGQFDASTKTLADEGSFSCPVTGETHRWYRTAWTVSDSDHTTYESYSRTPEGREFKSMEIRYTRAQ